MRCRAAWITVVAGYALVASGCRDVSRDPSPDAGSVVDANLPQRELLTPEELLDPKACQTCHPGQFAEWAGSMHAYASKDPVFLAMNALGQQQTEGQLGDFCVKCHAPMAVTYGLTTDGLNLEQLPEAYQGVTCYFCHNVAAVEGTHNNPLLLALDSTMRGPFGDAAPVAAHRSEYSPHLDTEDVKSAQMCGSCHDVAVQAHFAPANVALERSFEEWKDTIFSAPTTRGGLTCNGCHMPTTQARSQSAVGDYPQRVSRRHDFEGVDIAVTPFVGEERQRLLVQQFLDTSLLAEVCVSRAGLVSVTLENSAGHHWPSGASHDRLAWVQVEVFDDEGMIYRTYDPELDPPNDVSVEGQPAPALTDHVFDEQGNEAHFFWQVAAVRPETLPGVASRDPQSPDYHRERKTWVFDTVQFALDNVRRVELTVKIRPIKLAVLRDLEERGLLSSEVVEAMPTFELLPQRCHTRDEVERHSEILLGANVDCDATEPLHRTTLTWERSAVETATRNVRDIVLDGATARCFAHPTYIPPEQ